ncbi:MAG: DNA repair protein RecO [Salinisphaera sp.]|jgi:DNA repair protein RecO (recombination protein O)|nr:DNA repair protein RecO [Salinisphaera sp.]
MRVELTPSLILHRRPWRDTSLIIEALSREHGRIAAIAKGARRATSRWRGLMEPLSAVELSWSGRGELYTLTGVEIARSYPLKGKALMGGLYASELIMRLTARDDPHPMIYDSLLALLSALVNGAPPIVGLRFFERDLLDELGYGIDFMHTSDTGTLVQADASYRYHADRGVYIGGGVVRDGEIALSGHALIGLVEGRFASRDAIREARNLMQAAIAPHLGNRPLKSVQTLQAMQQFAAGGRSPPAPPPGEIYE